MQRSFGRLVAFVFAALLVFGLFSFSLIAPASAEAPGTWNQTATFPFNSEGTGCSSSGDIIFCVGGYDWNTNADVDNVYYGTMSSSGINSWTATMQYPVTTYIPACVSSDGYIYCVGGADSDATYYAEYSASGVYNNAWYGTTDYPTGIEGESCVVSDGYITCVGGTSGGPIGDAANVYYAPLENPGIGTWTETTDYACTSSCGDSGSTGIPTSDLVCGVTGTSTVYITCIGGEEKIYVGGSNPYDYPQVGSAYYSTLTDGAVGSTWTETTTYPVSIDSGQGSCVTSGGYMYCVAGNDGSNGEDNYVKYSQVTSGALGTWTSASDYAQSVYTQQCVVYSGDIYCMTGQTNTSVTPYSYYTAIASSLAATTTSVSCSPNSVAAGSSSLCTATVTGSFPTGTVTWTSSSGTGNFHPAASCTLTAGACDVSYFDSTSGAPVITAAYGGDSGNSGSSGSFILANFSPEATAAESTSTSTSGGGAASANQQGTTGIDVSVTGATPSTATTIFSAVLPSQPPSTGTLSITGLGYYDVRISGISSGTANVCIYNAGVISSTVLQYYFGGSWMSATGVVDTPGTSICGNIPVSALNGTPLVPGDPPSPTSVPEFPVTWALPVMFLAAAMVYLFLRRGRSTAQDGSLIGSPV